MRKLLMCVALLLTGCTTQATRLAIQQYQKSQAYQQLAFNNSTRIANEQMLLNLEQYIRLNSNDPAAIIKAVSATWGARNQLELSREQFLYAQNLAALTAGQYLYNQQGVLNVWFESKADTLVDASKAADAANKAAGITSVRQLLPTTQPTKQSGMPLNVLEDMFPSLLRQTLQH